MAKILLLAIGLLLAYWVLRAYRRKADRDAQSPPPADGEDMVRCAQCGVHLPRSDSIAARGSHYCSAEHERQHGAARRTDR